MRLHSRMQIQIPGSEIELQFETNLCLIRQDVQAVALALSIVIGMFLAHLLVSYFGFTALEE